MKKAAKIADQSDTWYNIVASMRAEIEFLTIKLLSDYGVIWETPLAFLVRRTSFAVACEDAYLDKVGG